MVRIRRWQEEGRALRERLLSERDALAKRLGEIDKRLSMIPTEKGADGPGHAIRQPQEATLERVSPRDSLADVVRKLLRAAAKPLAAGEVVGRVLEARSLSHHGYGLDEAAERAIRTWQFSPALRDGHPVRVRMRWTVQFRLR